MRSLTAAVLLMLPGIALAAPPADFDSRLEASRKRLETPGVSVVIVENGETTLARGYGVRLLGATDPADADTLFQIGSASKAFTAAALAVLVDEGKIKWDDPVIDHLPGFRMYDPWVTREMTIRDLLVHRSGLGPGQGDLMMVPATTISRAETVRRLRYLKPVTSFRSAYAYDNVLYIVAGQLIEEVSGQTWEDFVRDRLLKPAGMNHSVTNDADRYKVADRAMPHGRMGEVVRGEGPQQALDERSVALGANSGPAGAIASTANDMARWIKVQLAEGAIPGSDRRLFSQASAREMWEGVTPIRISPWSPKLAEATPKSRIYALGWIVQNYRGHQVVQHGGATQGFRASVTLIPEKKVGFAIMVNSEDNVLIPGLQAELLDHYLGLPKGDWPKEFADFFDQRTAAAVAATRTSSTARTPSKPSLPLASYAGVYADNWYGKVAVRETGGRLVIDFLQTPGMTGPLEHWAHDTFITRFPDRTIEPAFVTFPVGPDGKPERMAMKAASPTADFSFDYADLDLRPVPAAK